MTMCHAFYKDTSTSEVARSDEMYNLEDDKYSPFLEYIIE